MNSDVTNREFLNLSFFIARRYLFSKRKKNFINIISWLSVVVVAFITAALIIVLSVFNGLGDLLKTLNNSFDPPIKIEAAQGKTFAVSDSLLRAVREVKGVAIVTEVLEDYVYVRYADANQIVTLKGVGDNFSEHHRLDNSMVAGDAALTKDGIDYAVIGQGIDINLSVDVTNPLYPLQLYYIKNPSAKSLDVSSLYTQRNIAPGGVFSIVQNLNDNYILVPLRVAQELMGAGSRRTSLEVKVKENASLDQVQQEISSQLGDAFVVLTQEEQHKELYRLVKMEKLFTFLAFSLLLGIGAINIFFSLMMLAIDKKKDLAVLSAMGADAPLIRKIFVSEGAFIALLGSGSGLLLGGLVCWLQLEYGLVSMGMESAVIDGYPIKPLATDFALTMIVVALITFLISSHPARLAARSASVQNL